MPKTSIYTLIFFILAFAGCKQEGVSPKGYDVYLAPGKSNDFVLSVDLTNPPASSEPIDVVFTFDASGSMKSVIETVKSNAADIVNEIKNSFTNIQFAIISFNEDYRIHQNLTTNIGDTLQALNSVSLLNGENEIYNQVLDRVRLLNWRQNARKFIVLFSDSTDAPLDFPSPEAFRNVVARLKTDGVTVLNIYQEGWFKIFHNSTVQDFQFLADETNGLSISVNSAEEVPGAIKAGLKEIYLLKPQLVISPDFINWVSASAPKKQSESNRNFTFDVHLKPPLNAPDGIYRFPLKVLHGGLSGGEIGECFVTIRIGLRNYSWRGPFLMVWPILWGILLLNQAAKHTKAAIRYERNPLVFIQLIWNLLMFVIIIGGIYLIFKFAPGILPDPPTGASTESLTPVNQTLSSGR
jgi:hypothetical protein